MTNERTNYHPIRKSTLAIGDPISSASRLASRAIERGYEVVELRTFSNSTEYYSRGYNPELFVREVVHEGDYQATLKSLHNVKHILVGADSSIGTVERLNRLRGELKSDPTWSTARHDKVEQSRAFQLAGLQILPQSFCQHVDAALAWAEGRYPIVVKPRASGGTNNVFLAKNPDELGSAFAAVVSSKSLYDRSNEGALVMEYVEPTLAEEIVIDSVSCGDLHIVTDAWKYMKEPLNGTPAMYRAMIALPFDDVSAEIAYTHRLLDSVGYRQGPSHAEVWRLSSDLERRYGTRHLPVEVGFRLPGLITALSAEATGRDQVELTLDSVVDQEAFVRRGRELPPRGGLMQAAAVVFLAAPHSGTLKGAPPVPDVLALRSYHSSNFKAPLAGKRLQKTVDVATLAGWVALCDPDPEIVGRDMEAVRNLESEFTTVEEDDREDLSPTGSSEEVRT